MTNKHTISKGFTLVELLIVVAAIALLVILVVTVILKNITKANDAKRKSDLQKISTALEDYYGDNNCYPLPSVFSDCNGGSFRPYLQSVPCDPVYKYPYCYLAFDPSPTDDCYQKYRLLTTLKNISDADIEALGCTGSTCGWELACGATSVRSGFNYGVTSKNTYLAHPQVTAAPSSTPGSSSSSPSPTPTASSLPPQGDSGPYACAFDGVCNNFGSLQQALNQGCLTTFSDGDVCQEYCDYSSTYWCPRD